MMTIANTLSLTKPDMNTTNCDVWMLSKVVMGLSISRSAGGSFETSTRTYEGLSGVTTQGEEFLESRKRVARRMPPFTTITDVTISASVSLLARCLVFEVLHVQVLLTSCWCWYLLLALNRQTVCVNQQVCGLGALETFRHL